MASRQWDIIAIVGPTSSGKTELSLELADMLNGEIISADSRQIYMEISIGTGKPSNDQLTKIKHYLISEISPAIKMTAYEFSKMADDIYKKIIERKKQCFLVGGTGLWIKAFCEGLHPTPPPDPEYRNVVLSEISKNGLNSIYQELMSRDPGLIGKIKPNDKVRIIRAMEILYNSGSVPSEIYRNTLGKKYNILWIGCYKPKEVLYQIAEQKINLWIANGWIEEVRELSIKYGPDLPAMQTLGYFHILRYIAGSITKENMIMNIKLDTRHYIKRQFTWFRSNKQIHWVDTRKTIAEQVNEVLGAVSRIC
ncbi:MAG: tRNA (adenosine(37)-N6)-dimethylallyltransferase MiaA [candidate division FCPU426 bacterium]